MQLHPALSKRIHWVFAANGVATDLGEAMMAILNGKGHGHLLGLVGDMIDRTLQHPATVKINGKDVHRPALEVGQIETVQGKIEAASDDFWKEKAARWKEEFDKNGEKAANGKFKSLINFWGLSSIKNKTFSLNAPLGDDKDSAEGIANVQDKQKSVEDQAQQNMFSDPKKVKLIKEVVPKMSQLLEVAVPEKLKTAGFDSDAYLLDLVGLGKEKWAQIVKTVAKNADACDIEHGQECMMAYGELLKAIPLMQRLVGVRSQGVSDNRIKLFFKHIKPIEGTEKIDKIEAPFHEWENIAGTLRKLRSELGKKLKAKNPNKTDEYDTVLSELQKHLNAMQKSEEKTGMSSTKILEKVEELGANHKDVAKIQEYEDKLKSARDKGHRGPYNEGYKLVNTKYPIKDYLAALAKNAEEFKTLLSQIREAYTKTIGLIRRARFGLSSRIA